MDWINILNQAGNVAQGAGLLNYNLNSYKNDNTLQGRLNQWGSGISGEDPIMKAFTMHQNTHALRNDLDNYVESTPYANTTSQILDLYKGYKPLETVKRDSFGRIWADNLLASAQGAKNGLAVGGAWGALAGGILGGVVNLGTNIAREVTREHMNKDIREANLNKISTMNNNIESVNSLTNYNNRANMAAFGGQFTNGISEFNAGGTHEENPKGGIQVGVGGNGLPNTVEEGEVRDDKNNYIYSNRLVATVEDLESVFIPKKYANKSFADIAKLLSKELQDRPNDGPSRKSNEIMLERLRNAQELKKSEIQKDIIVSMAKKYKVDPIEIESVLSESREQQNQFGYGGYGNTNYLTTLFPKEWHVSPDSNNISPSPLKINNKFGLDEVLFNMQNDAYYNGDMFYKPTPITSTVLPKVEITRPNIDNNKILKDAEEKYMSSGFNSTDAMMKSPIIGNLLALGANMAKGKDYTFADKIMSMKPKTMAPALINDYMSYDPVNSVFNQNQIKSIAAGTRSKLKDSAGGNAAIERASMLGADSNLFEALGKSMLMDNQTNLERKKLASEFNKNTNQINADSINRANASNLEASMQNDQLMYNALLLKQKIKDEYEAAISQNLTGLFDNISDIGRNKFNNNMLAGIFGYTIGKDGKVKPVKQ